MPLYPALLDEQRRILFEIVEVFRKCKMEGRAITICGPTFEDRRLQLLVPEVDPLETPCIDTDFDTLRVLDQAGYIAFSEKPNYDGAGLPYIVPSLTLKKLASDYYDWAHRPAIYRNLSEVWYYLRPFVLPALISSIFTLLVWIILNRLWGGGTSMLP